MKWILCVCAQTQNSTMQLTHIFSVKIGIVSASWIELPLTFSLEQQSWRWERQWSWRHQKRQRCKAPLSLKHALSLSHFSVPHHTGFQLPAEKEKERCKIVFGGKPLSQHALFSTNIHKLICVLTRPYSVIVFIVAVSKLKVFVHSGYFMLYKTPCE